MKKNYITAQLNEGIYDIQAPVTPPASGLEQILLIAITIFVLGALVYVTWKQFFSSKGKITRQIKKLNKAYTNNEITLHQTAYMLCFLLQKGLDINHIGKETSLPGKLLPYQEDWQSFAANLSALRYMKKHAHMPDMEKLFSESLFWLRGW